MEPKFVQFKYAFIGKQNSYLQIGVVPVFRAIFDAAKIKT